MPGNMQPAVHGVPRQEARSVSGQRSGANACIPHFPLGRSGLQRVQCRIKLRPPSSIGELAITGLNYGRPAPDFTLRA